MKKKHSPKVNARYWAAIILASVFGTNMGDLYAHESGLGIVSGLGLLAVLTAIVFTIERFDDKRHEIYYWLVIILIRTGATNIADYLAYQARIPDIPLVLGLTLLLVLFGWGTMRRSAIETDSRQGLPPTKAAYWLAMLSAGVFGTVVGDICEHLIGEGVAAAVLTLLFFAVLFAGRGRNPKLVWLYWATVTTARTAGTAVGDWLAENKIIPIGLPFATLLSGIAFVAILVFWKSQSSGSEQLEQAA